jgi:hypothetical protein
MVEMADSASYIRWVWLISSSQEAVTSEDLEAMQEQALKCQTDKSVKFRKERRKSTCCPNTCKER